MYHGIDSKFGYYMFTVNEEGYSIDNALDSIIAAIKENEYTDIVLFAHGWNTSYNEDNSIIFANSLIPKLEMMRPSDMKPLYICFKWPSMVSSGINIGYGITPSVKNDSERELNEKTFEQRHNEIMRGLWDERGVCYPEKIQYEDLDAIEKHLLKSFAKTFGKKFILSELLGILGKIGLLSWSTQDIVFRHLTRRAYTVGARGLHMLTAYIMKLTSSTTKIHVYGFSMGATVALASAIGTAPGSAFARKIHSLFIFQGAVNHDWLGAGEIFRPITNILKPIAGHIIFTYAEKDMALLGFNVANSAFRLQNTMQAVGYKGALVDAESSGMDCKEVLVDEILDETFSFVSNTIYNVDCGSLEGFHHHSLDMEEIVSLFIKSASTTIDESAYDNEEHSKLPDGFWNKYKVRTL